MKEKLGQFALLFTAGSIGLALFAGCGDGKGTPMEPATVDDGWREFEAGNYGAAIGIFQDVLAEGDGENEARNGLGWSFAYSGDLDSARQWFDAAVARDSAMVDAEAGMSAVLLGLGDASGAAARAGAALDRDGEWSFSHRSGVDHDDLHLILAQAYFNLGEAEWSTAQAEVDLLDPANGLDPADSATWNGLPSYGAALLKEIEKIEEEVGSVAFAA